MRREKENRIPTKTEAEWKGQLNQNLDWLTEKSDCEPVHPLELGFLFEKEQKC
jgi:hypothetical protein